MYDFLDKIGLKAVLEAIKGKMPTSLPANGGNADTVGGKSASDFVLAVTEAQTANTRVLIPNDVDVADWLAKNAKSGTLYFRTQDSSGQSNLPLGTNSWAWFMFDGNKYFASVMVSDFSTRDFLLDKVNLIGGWKEISTTPIKSAAFSGTTGNSGNMSIWGTSERKIPLFAEIVDLYCFTFLSSSNSGSYMIHAFDSNGDKALTTVSGTVYYIEI